MSIRVNHMLGYALFGTTREIRKFLDRELTVGDFLDWSKANEDLIRRVDNKEDRFGALSLFDDKHDRNALLPIECDIEFGKRGFTLLRTLNPKWRRHDDIIDYYAEGPLCARWRAIPGGIYPYDRMIYKPNPITSNGDEAYIKAHETAFMLAGWTGALALLAYGALRPEIRKHPMLDQNPKANRRFRPIVPMQITALMLFTGLITEDDTTRRDQLYPGRYVVWR